MVRNKTVYYFIKIFIFLLLFLLSCLPQKKEFKDVIKVYFSYFRSENFILLGLTVYNDGNESVPFFLRPNSNFSFFIDGKSKPPLIKTRSHWRTVALPPKIHKYVVKYTNVKELSQLLGPGKHRLWWELGPVRSNELILEVTEDGEIKEIAVECLESLKELGISVYRRRMGIRH